LSSSAPKRRKADDGKKNEQRNFNCYNFCALVHAGRTPGKRIAGFPHKEQRSKVRAKAQMKSSLRKRLRRNDDSQVKRVGT
jgi:hypothetical protein